LLKLAILIRCGFAGAIVTSEPLAADPLAADPLAADPLAADPLAVVAVVAAGAADADGMPFSSTK
jgi:hypothetical protein